MIRRRRLGSAAVALALTTLASCGKAGPPLPPLRPMPGRIADATAHRIDDDVEVRFTVPAANADGTMPAIIERVEIYGVSQAAATPAPTPAELTVAKNLKTRIAVRRPPSEDEKAAAPAATPAPSGALGPLPGDAARFRDPIAASERGESARVRYYIVVGVAGRDRRGGASPVLTVPLATTPAPPTGLAMSYDEHTLKLTWAAGEAGTAFRVYDAASTTTPGEARPPAVSGAAPLQSPAFSTPVEFGKERCFVVRAVTVTGPTTIEGAPSEPACKTPVDTFPPAAPDGLRAIAEEDAVTLSWNSLEAPDVAGYIVLRGDGAGDTLTPLMTAPISGTSYRDTNVTKGATYTYAVVAVDTAPAQNRSAPSNRQTVTVR